MCLFILCISFLEKCLSKTFVHFFSDYNTPIRSQLPMLCLKSQFMIGIFYVLLKDWPKNFWFPLSLTDGQGRTQASGGHKATRRAPPHWPSYIINGLCPCPCGEKSQPKSPPVPSPALSSPPALKCNASLMACGSGLLVPWSSRLEEKQQPVPTPPRTTKSSLFVHLRCSEFVPIWES